MAQRTDAPGDPGAADHPYGGPGSNSTTGGSRAAGSPATSPAARFAQVEPSSEWTVRLAARDDDGEERFVVHRDGRDEVFRLHDYAAVYRVPGLYEHVVQGLMRCTSPAVAVRVLRRVLDAEGRNAADLSVLEIGAGTGVVGELVRELGVRSVVGVDSLDEAREAALRDRPGVFDDYVVADLSHLSDGQVHRISGHRPDCLLAVGALGGDHVGVDQLARALDLLAPPAVVVLTIRADQLDPASPEPFGSGLDGMVEAGRLRIVHREEFPHRTTYEGDTLTYVALGGVVGGIARPATGSSQGTTEPGRGVR